MKKVELSRVSQIGEGATYGQGDCGFACLSMILAFHNIDRTVDSLSIEAQYEEGFTITDSQDMQKLARKAGIQLDWKRFSDISVIKSEIDSGRPVIVLVWYPYLKKQYKTYINNHFIVITGYDSENLYYHDPYWKEPTTDGVYEPISYGDFLRAWKFIASKYGSYNCIMTTNNPVRIAEGSEELKFIVDIRWNSEQSIRDIEEQLYQAARQRLRHTVVKLSEKEKTLKGKDV